MNLKICASRIAALLVPITAPTAFSLCLTLFLLPSAAGLCTARRDVALFYIERSKNANIVRYDARLMPDGALDAKQPVVGYWVLLADKGQRKDLSWLEKKKAYGFNVEPDKGGKGFVMLFKPMHERPIHVYKDGDFVRAELAIGGKPGFLDKLFIKSEEGAWLPKVIYIELFGKDTTTGKPLYEKIIPKN